MRAPDAALPPLPTDAPVRVRSVPWERMSATLAELNARNIASDVAPEDWSSEKRAEAQANLLRGLQVSADPASVTVIGLSEFRTTRPLRLNGNDEPALAAFARSVGANEVVWSSRDLGMTQTVVDRPVTTVSTGTFWGSRTQRNGWWNDGYSETTTSWVPVTVMAQETGFYTYFLHKHADPSHSPNNSTPAQP